MEESKTLLKQNVKANVSHFGTKYYFSATSLPEHFKSKKTQKNLKLLKSFDTFVSVFVITPLCVANWQSVWFLYDIYGIVFPFLASFAFANVVLIGWTFLRIVIRDSYKKYKARYENLFLWRIVKSIYIVDYNAMLVMQWRGAFYIFDEICSVTLNQLGYVSSLLVNNVIIVTSVSVCALIGLRSLRNALAVPFIIALDKWDKIFFYPTRFRMDSAETKTTTSRFSFRVTLAPGVSLSLFLLKMQEMQQMQAQTMAANACAVQQPSKFGKFRMDVNENNTNSDRDTTVNLNIDTTSETEVETATTKFVIVVTILGIIFFIVLYLLIILKSDSHLLSTPSPTFETKQQNKQNQTKTNDRQLTDNIDRMDQDNSSDNQASAETLTAPLGKYPPRPFINNYRGPTPASFLPTRPRPTSVTYAQLQNYNVNSQVRAPHNIQDIIGFLMPSEKKQTKTYGMKPFFNTNSHDPFHTYKPKDPSDINLLATANLRFAPPIWKEINPNINANGNSNSNSVKTSSVMQPYDTIYEQQQQATMAKNKNTRALSLTLNVFPMANDPRQEHFYAVSSNMIPNMANRNMPQPKKMIIHLNLYQNEAIMNRGEINMDEDYEIERNLIERNMNGLQQVLNKNVKM